LKTVCMMVLFFLVSSVQAKELTLEQALDLAKKNTTELQILDAEHALATASFQRSAQAFLPKISIDTTFVRTDSSLISDIPVPLPGLVPRLSYRDFGPVDGMIRGIQVIQPVFNADALKAREQANKLVQARRMAYEWGEQVIRFQVAGSYYAVAVSQADERAARMALEAALKAQAMATGAYQEGFAAKLDVVRAHAEVAAGRARIGTAEAQVRKARINLAVLLDLPPQEHFILTGDLPEPLPPLEERTPSKKRSDLKAREAEQEAASAGVDKAKAQRLPRINLLARQQWFDGDDPFDMSADGWLVAINLQWSLFDGLGNQGEIAEARARKTLARIGVEHTRRMIEKEQQLAISEWQAAWSAWQASVNALTAAKEALKLAHRRYEENLGDMADLLSTQAALYQRRLEYTRYHYNALLASMNYCLRYGKDPLTVLPGEFR
jgi:outer membrane protein TolC